MTASVDRAGPCEDCGAPRERGQRYCLECGARAGSRSPQLDELLRRVRADRAAELAGAAVAGAGPGTARCRPAGVAGGRPWISSIASDAPLLTGLGGARADVPRLRGDGRQRGRHARAGHARRGRRPAREADPAARGAGGDAEHRRARSRFAVPRANPRPRAPNRPRPRSAPRPRPRPAQTRLGQIVLAIWLRRQRHGSGGGEGGSATPAPSGSSSKLPPVKHVFVIMLSDQPYASVFGPTSRRRYLSQTLEHKGELLVRYYAVAHEQLANGIALISGQGPTAETAANCPNYSAIAPATVGADEQVTGSGCVYPSSTETLPGQLAAKHLTWRAYIEGMGEGPGTTARRRRLRAPGARRGRPDARPRPPAGQTYATWRNPFVYFGSLTGAPCVRSRRRRPEQLSADLANPEPHAELRLHRSRPLPRRQPDALRERSAGRAWRRPKASSSGSFPRSSARRPTRKTACSRSPSTRRPPAANSPTRAPAAVSRSSRTCRPPTSALGPEGGGQVGALLLSPYIKAGRQPGTVQPLLAAAHDRGPVRPEAPGLRGAVEGQLLRTVDLLAHR